VATSSAVRQIVTYPTLTTVLTVGVLFVASVAPLYAEPGATQPVSEGAPFCTAASVPRSGFLLPTLPGPATAAAPRLMLTERAFRGAVRMRLTHTAGQAQATPSQSWWSRNWLWVVVPVAVVAYVIVSVCTGPGLDARCSN
jgi:hypothetical protein